MKSLLLLTAAAATLTALPFLARGQNPVPAASPGPATPGTKAGPQASPAATPSNSPNPGSSVGPAAGAVPLPGQPSGPSLENNKLPLIPEPAPSASPQLMHGAAHPASSPATAATFQTEQDLKARLRMRQAKNIALNDPALQVEWTAAHQTRTDPERRTRLTAFYNHLYARMAKIDPSVADHINLRLQSVLARLKYTRLDDAANYGGLENPLTQSPSDTSSPNPPTSE